MPRTINSEMGRRVTIGQRWSNSRTGIHAVIRQVHRKDGLVEMRDQRGNRIFVQMSKLKKEWEEVND